jgi:tRNA wybutosine-synthesizing protein 2
VDAAGAVVLHDAVVEALDRLRSAADAAGRSVERLDDRVVKDHSAGVVHGVVDARIH